MNYKYNCGKEIISVWVWDDDFHTEVSVSDNKTKRSYERTIREDEGGKFFTWNKNKIYLDKWIRASMKEVKEKLKRSNKTILYFDIYDIERLVKIIESLESRNKAYIKYGC